MNYMKTLTDHLLLAGEIAVMPTDTVYGVVARAVDPEAVARLYQLKRRENKPGTLIAASVEQLVQLGIERQYVTQVQRFWPGPVSIIIPCGPRLEYIHQGKASLAVRIPSDKAVIAVLEKTGPLVTSSANQPGEPPATTVAEAIAYFGNDVTWYEDGGVVNGEPSTVVRVEDGAIVVIRQGAGKILSAPPADTV